MGGRLHLRSRLTESCLSIRRIAPARATSISGFKQFAGGEAVKLTRLSGEEENPAFSPDGTKVIFCYHAPQDTGLYVVSTLGGEPRKIVDLGHDARFSPDGSRIVYRKQVKLANGLFVAGTNGENARRLAMDFFDAREAYWSADGKHILFMGSQEAGRPADHL